MHIQVRIPALKTTIPAEVYGTTSQGKPRLRKDDSNNRSKLHLVPLVMAAARLPEPAREEKRGKVAWPLENKRFLVSDMEFEVAERSGDDVVLIPAAAHILHSAEIIDLAARFNHIADDLAAIGDLQTSSPDLADAIQAHASSVMAGVNTKAIRDAADAVIARQKAVFGSSNSATITTIKSLPPTPLEEDITGTEGRVLTRLHAYRERDRRLVARAKALFQRKHGKVFCECCGFEPEPFYGDRATGRIQAHHRRPVEELLPDTVTRPEDLAMVCPNCHDVIHAKRPWITVEDLRDELRRRGVSRIP